MILLGQRDPKWSAMKLGQSNVTVGSHGCVITSIAMFSDWYKEYKDPGTLSKALTFTSTGLLYWSSISKVFKTITFKWRFYSHDKKLITTALSSKWDTVLLNVDRNKHWVAALYHVPFVGYRCSDPWTKTNRTYTYSEVGGGALLTKK